MLDFSPEKLDLARKYLENVEVVIVDEMSLVSSDNLYNLHKRLQEIFATDEEFFCSRALLLHCKYLQPVYSHWLCYVYHCNLVVIITDNDSTHDIL